jgi:hypothetical protein
MKTDARATATAALGVRRESFDAADPKLIASGIRSIRLLQANPSFLMLVVRTIIRPRSEAFFKVSDPWNCGARVSTRRGAIRPFCRSDPRHPRSCSFRRSNGVERASAIDP